MKIKRFFIIFIIALVCLPVFAQDISREMPGFKTYSNDPVLFRYKHTVGQRVSLDLDLNITMNIKIGDKGMDVDVAMKMAGYYTVKEVASNGSTLVDYIFTRIIVKSKSPAPMEYDSDKPDSSTKEFTAFQNLLNVPIIMKIDPRGKVLSTDINPIMQAIAKASSTIKTAEIEKQVHDFTKSTFIQLSEKPLKKGDLYDAGNIVNDIPVLGSMTVSVQYKVAAVSGDKKLAILEPLVDIQLKGLDMSKSGLKGWILFDLEKGNIVRSYEDLHIEFEFTQGDQTVPVILNSEGFYSTKF
jgi:hypothetical protein